MVNNVNDVMEEFDSNSRKGNINFIKVKESNRTAFQAVVGEDGSLSEIRADLEAWLEKQAKNPDNSNKYEIQFFKTYKQTKNGIVGNEPIHCTLQFKPNHYQQNIGAVGYYNTAPISPELAAILKNVEESNKAILSLLAAQQAEEDLEEEEPEKLSGLNGLMESDEFKQLAIGTLGAIMQKFLAPTQAGAIAGIEEDEQLNMANEAITKLKQRDAKYGEHLLYLANVNAIQYNMLLSFMK